MAIQKVIVTSKWLRENALIRQYKTLEASELTKQNRRQVTADEERYDVAGPTSTEAYTLPLSYATYPDDPKSHAIYLTTPATVYVGFDEEHAFHQPIQLNKNKLNEEDEEELIHLYLYTDTPISENETEIDRGLLFETEEQAKEFESLYGSTKQYYQSSLFTDSPFYLCLSHKTKKVFEAEGSEYRKQQRKNKKEKKAQQGTDEQEMPTFPTLKVIFLEPYPNKKFGASLGTPDHSRWLIVAFNREFTYEHIRGYFKQSLQTQNALLSKAQKYGKIDKQEDRKTVKQEEGKIAKSEKTGFWSFFKKSGKEKKETQSVTNHNPVQISTLVNKGVYNNQPELLTLK